MSTILNALIALVTGCFTSIVSWVPILIMAAFTLVGTATGIVTNIVPIADKIVVTQSPTN